MDQLGDWRQCLRRFRKDQAGNIGLMFGFALLPMLIAVGVAVTDYARVADIRAKLNGAADMATLASISKDAQPFLNTPTQAGVQKYFNAIASTVAGVTVASISVKVVPSVTNMTVTLTYTGQVNTIFGGLIGINSVAISGTSTAQVNAPPYVNFYMLLDNSPSMGLGATAADISALQGLTPDNCAFACHQHSFNSKGQITGDNLSDYYHIAKNNNVTLRIDVLRTATQQLTQTASSSETMSNQFQMGVYTFSDTFQAVAPLSSSMATVSSNANAVDLAYAYNNQRDAQTSYDTALTYINNLMPNPGNGMTPSAAQEFVFLVTDGVEDEPVSASSGSKDPPDTPLSYLPPNNQPNLSNTHAGNVNSGRLITTIDGTSASSICTQIKNRGIKIAILYTPYLPVTNNAFYNQWVASMVNNGSIVQQLTSCASPDFFFQVTPTQGISDAMQAMFRAAINSVLLTN
jgi:Flp pilus assembly protein TadG